MQEFRCEVGGIVTSDPIHWFVIDVEIPSLPCSDGILGLPKLPEPRHYCGEAHAQVYISRWFESVCAPPKPTFV